MTFNVPGSIRVWIVLGLVALAMAVYPTPQKDPLLMPDEPKRFNWRKLIPSRRRAEEEAGEREADSFVTDLRDARRDNRDIASKTGPRPVPRTVQLGRHRGRPAPEPIEVVFPSFRAHPRPDLNAPGAPWDPAYEPEPENTGRHVAPAPVQDALPKALRPLEPWAPGDPSDPPTLVGGMLPVIDATVGEYVRNLPGYDKDDE